MIFPNIRISDLRRDADEKRAAYQGSKQRLFRRLRDKVRPMTFLREHPRLIASTLVTLLSMNKIFKNTVGRLPIARKKGAMGALIKLGWAWKALKLGRNVVKSLRSFTD